MSKGKARPAYGLRKQTGGGGGGGMAASCRSCKGKASATRPSR